MGTTNITTAQNSIESTKFLLCFEKKKNASPTTLYNLTNVPSMMKNAAQKSFSFSISQKARRSVAQMAMLNCCMKRAFSNSLAQNHKMNTCWNFVNADWRIAQ